MKATVLVDNLGVENMDGEWGLSIYIEYNGKNILLDAGASSLFVENASKLGVDLASVDFAVLSHAHYDHGNGMEDFFHANKKAQFFVRSACQENCYKLEGGEYKYIGIPEGILAAYPERITMAEGRVELAEGIILLPHTTAGLSNIGEREQMYLKEECCYRPDDFAHEQSLVFATPKGLVVFNSCSHGGADNIVREVEEAFPGQKVYGLIGGFHLFNKTEAEVRAFAQRLQENGVQHIVTGHCTGEAAYEMLAEALGDKLEQLRVGLVMEF